MTETMKDHRGLEFASNNEPLEESSVHFELIQESIDISTVLHYVQQGKLVRVTMFYDSYLLLEDENKCFELEKTYFIVHEQLFALQDNWNEDAIYQKLCHVALKHDKPVEGTAKDETQTMKASFGKKTDFEFKVSLVEGHKMTHFGYYHGMTSETTYQ